MADHNTQSKIRYDDFIAGVQTDPAKAESTIMMSGYIGHGADGAVRIYPDPTLGDWYDVAEADIVYSLPRSDSPLGGSYVWVRASADIKPGAAGSAGGADAGDAAPGAAQEAVRPGGGGTTSVNVVCAQPVHSVACGQTFFRCPPPPPPPHVTQQGGCTGVGCVVTHFDCQQLQAQQMLAAGPQAAQNWIHPTTTVLTLQPTPATHCFICPPRTIVTETCTPGAACTINVHCIHPTPTANPTPATLCSPPAICNQPISPNCPGPGPGTPVQQQGQAQQFAAAQPAANQWPTPATHCFFCPPPYQAQAQAQAPNFTIGQGCTFICAQQPAQPAAAANLPTPATHCFVCDPPAAQNIRPTGPLICSETCNTLLVGCATLPNNCVPRTLPNACQIQTAQPGCQTHPTFATICSETCNTHLIGCPTQNVFQCAGTQAQICHVQASPNCPGPGPGTPVQQQGAPMQQQGFAAAAMQPTPSAVGQCGGGGVGGIQPTPSAPQHCGNTAATLCTQNPCRSFVDCTMVGCTHIGCTHPPACQQHPTVATICSETCNTLLVGCHSQNVFQCLPQTLPQICDIVASPNCPGPGPGTPVQQPGAGVQQQAFGAAAALQPTPSAVQHCGGNTAATVCTHPNLCQVHPSLATVCTQVNCVHPTPTAVPSLATVCTHPNICQLHTVVG